MSNVTSLATALNASDAAGALAHRQDSCTDQRPFRARDSLSMGMDAPPYTVAASTKATGKKRFVFMGNKVESSFAGKQARGFTNRNSRGYEPRFAGIRTARTARFLYSLHADAQDTVYRGIARRPLRGGSGNCRGYPGSDAGRAGKVAG